jgi:hypothetical protein
MELFLEQILMRKGKCHSEIAPKTISFFQLTLSPIKWQAWKKSKNFGH